MKADGITFRRNRAYGFRIPENPRGNYCEFFNLRTGKAVEMDYHSLTNMAFTPKGQGFLARDGAVYTSAKARS